MINNLRKKGLLLALAAAFSFTAFTQAGSAASLEADQDLIVDIPDGFNAALHTDHELLIKHISVGDKLVSLVKFDISSIKGQVFSAANLKLTGNAFLTSTQANIPVLAYYVANDAFIDESVDIDPFTEADMFDLIGGVGATAVSSLDVNNVYQDWIFNLSAAGLAQLQADADAGGDNYFSFLVRTTADPGNADFQSRHSIANGGNDVPLLNVTPIPEPSSMLLGLMGIGSMLGLRKKQAKA